MNTYRIVSFHGGVDDNFHWVKKSGIWRWCLQSTWTNEDNCRSHKIFAKWPVSCCIWFLRWVRRTSCSWSATAGRWSVSAVVPFVDVDREAQGKHAELNLEDSTVSWYLAYPSRKSMKDCSPEVRRKVLHVSVEVKVQSCLILFHKRSESNEWRPQAFFWGMPRVGSM